MKKKPETKVSRVLALCKKGTTIAAIAKALNVSTVAAQSLIADARKKAKVHYKDRRYYA